METECNGMVKKIFFDEGVDEKKRKEVKSKLFTENKGILLLDMTQKFNLKSGTTDTVACDILTITNGPIEFNALKKEIQDDSNEGYIVSQPYGIAGGERIIVKKVDSRKQEAKFLTVSFCNRESKVMLQGNHKHLMTFMDKHFATSKSGTNREEYNDQFAKPKQNNKQKHFNKEEETTEGDYLSEAESDLSSIDYDYYNEVFDKIAKSKLNDFRILFDQKMDDLQRLQKEKEKGNSQQIKKLIQIIDDKDQLMKDNETKFINKLKQQEKQFMDIINELRENQNGLRLKYRQDNEKLNGEVNNLKRQLKMVQKEFEDFKEGQSFMALSPSIVHTKSVDYNDFPTTSKKNTETLLKNSFSVLETMEDEQIANSHTPIEEISQTDKPSKTLSKNILNPKIDTGKEFKSSTTSETHIRPQTYQNERSTNGPILILCNSMYSVIKRNEIIKQNIYKQTVCSRRQDADLIKIVTDLNDSITYSSALIHVGTNNIFNTTEQEIIEEISKLVTIIKQKWPNTEIVYSSIILHKTNSRKNIIINNLNQEIKQLSVKLPFRFMDNTHVALLPSRHIDNEAFFDNLHLNN